MIMKISEIKSRLQEALEGAMIFVRDLTGTSDHFQVVAVSNRFEGLSLLDQHRLIYAPLQKDIQGAIHALSIKTFTVNQWSQSPLRNEVENGNSYS